MSALERLLGASSAQQALGERLPRPGRRTTWGVAIAAPVLITLAARLIGPSVPPATLMFATLLVVAVAALLGGARPACATILAGLAAQEVLFGFPYGALNDHRPAQIAVLVVFVALGLGIGLLVDELVRISAEQAALRRVASLVAGATPPAQLFAAVADEVANLLEAELAVVAQVGAEGSLTIAGVGGAKADAIVVGDAWPVESPLAVATVVRTHRPAYSGDYSGASAQLEPRIRGLGVRSSIATPVIVDHRLWGVIVAATRHRRPSRDAERRMLEFTELVATAIADAQRRSELAASRARIVAASDEARRRIERNLHDGVQQRLVSLALEVRSVEAALPPEAHQARAELSHVVDGLTGSLHELREIARGIHPSILTEGGLGAALRALARRAPLPIALDVSIDEQPSGGVEVGVYYAVSEIVTNAAKHAHASRCDITLTSSGGVLHLLARDDGVGGANPARGSGLVGLRDRVEALGGSLSVASASGHGTTIEVGLPCDGGAGSTHKSATTCGGPDVGTGRHDTVNAVPRL